MILAAGLGTRVRPLSDLRPKPALPVRGLPLCAYLFELLTRHGVSEVLMNVHHLPEVLKETAERHCPPGLRLRFSHEARPLGTGGGIRRAAAFLRESDPSLIVGGDMILDMDLGALVARHRERRDALTLLLLDDARAAGFGTIGVAADGRVRRIARRFDLGGEVRCGVYPVVNVVASRALDTLPEREAFNHLDDWVVPRLRAGAGDIRGDVVDPSACRWEPVGTLPEYLAANLSPKRLSYLDADARAAAAGTRFEGDVVVGAGARIGPGAELRRAVVWDGEEVPAGLHVAGGVFAGGAFRPCAPERAPREAQGRGGR